MCVYKSEHVVFVIHGEIQPFLRSESPDLFISLLRDQMNHGLSSTVCVD